MSGYFLAVETDRYASVAVLCGALGLPEADVAADVARARAISSPEIVVLERLQLGPPEAGVYAALQFQDDDSIKLYVALLGQASEDVSVVEAQAAVYKASPLFAGKRVLIVEAQSVLGALH
jgi:hypothetical protein